jgi:predicted ATPase
LRLQLLKIKNFRGIDEVEISFRGDSAVLIGPNGSGKSSILNAVAKATGRDRAFAPEDFTDPSSAIEVVCVLGDLTAESKAAFANQLVFGNDPTVTLGARATLEDGEVDARNGFPDHGWIPTRRKDLDTLPLIWLPAERESRRLLSFTGNRSILATIVDQLDLEDETATALQAFETAAQAFATSDPIESLALALAKRTGRILPRVSRDDVGIAFQRHVNFLDLLTLLVRDRAREGAPWTQSSGTAQSLIFATAIELAGRLERPLLMLDEPELSLHPQAQRALMKSAFDEDVQVLASTHSAAILDRLDPRLIVRIARDGGSVHLRDTTAAATERDAQRIARHADPRIAESFFAERVILVEGASDRLALLSVADRRGHALDAEGVTVLSLEGNGLFKLMHEILGPRGFGIPIFGLCDADAETRWSKTVGEGQALTREDLANRGFFVADPDPEHLLVTALGVQGVKDLLNRHGALAQYERYANQPDKRGTPEADLLVRFVHGDNTRWLPLLMDELPDNDIPQVFDEVLDAARS